MRSLIDIQDDFADALLSTCSPVPPDIKGAAIRRAERRFAVYRNNVVVSLIEALADRFPVVKRLVGNDFFQAMARSYVLREPPLSPLLIHYGETFAAFIAGFEPAQPLPYLADIACLEYARGRAYHAADAEPLPAQSFADLPQDSIAATKVALHPSVFILSSAYPVFSIFAANQTESVTPVEQWQSEAVLIARPFLTVETVRLKTGVDTFLRALQRRKTIGDAAEAAREAEPDFDAADGLATLIGRNLAVSLSS